MTSRINNNSFALPSLLKEGTRHMQGLEDAVYRNIAACRQTAQMTSSSYGPLGLSKLILNAHQRLVLTSDAGAMLREVGIEHPAARILLFAAEQQKREHGDAGGWVCTIAGEFLAMGESLLRMGLAPSQVVEGFEIAAAKAEEALAEMATHSTDIRSVIRSVLSGKQYGLDELLTRLVMQAIEIVDKKLTHPADDDNHSFNADNVRVIKVMGASLEQSSVIKGMLFNREVEGHIKNAGARKDAVKVAIYACPLGAGRTETKGTVVFGGAAEMLAFNRNEEQLIEADIRAIAEAGVDVVVSGDTISDVAVHFLDAKGILALKVPSKFDLRRLARAIGATPLARMGVPMEEELGHASSVETVEIGSDRCVLFRASDAVGELATIIIRGSSPNQMDAIEKAIDDAVASVRAFRRDPRVLPGAGATEAELSKRIQAFAASCPGISQLAIRKFGDAFDAIPRVLACNAGLDDAEVLAKLHSSSLLGVNIAATEDLTCKPMDTGILDLYITKQSALKHAIDATLTILRVDQIIMSKPAGGPAPRAPGPMDVDD